MEIANFIITMLASYVVMKLVYEDFYDPFGVLWSIRSIIGWTFLRSVLRCQYCLAFWTSQVASHLVLQDFSLTTVMAGLGAYGAVFILVRAEELAEAVIYDGNVPINIYEDADLDIAELVHGSATEHSGPLMLLAGGVEID